MIGKLAQLQARPKLLLCQGGTSGDTLQASLTVLGHLPLQSTVRW